MVADAAAKAQGGRVIMCDTFEPPTEEDWPLPEEKIEGGEEDGLDGDAEENSAAFVWEISEKEEENESTSRWA